jgi:hypothetical protein
MWSWAARNASMLFFRPICSLSDSGGSELAGAGKLPTEELQAISQKSCGVLRTMGPQIQRVQSFVTDDKIYCIYVAPDESAVRAHAQKGAFPANSIARVRSVIDPTTAEVAL